MAGWGGARPGAGRKKLPANDNAGMSINSTSQEVKKIDTAPKAERKGPMFSDASVHAILEAAQQARAGRVRNRPRTDEWNPYKIRPELFGPVAEAIKKDDLAKKKKLAMDDNSGLINANGLAVQAWAAGGGMSNAVSEGLLFLGYPYLSELAQRPEFRLFGEIKAEEMTRKWTLFRGTDDESTKQADKPVDRNKDDEESDRLKLAVGAKPRNDGRNKEIEVKIKELQDFEKDLKVRGHFREIAKQDSDFGISHLFLDIDGAEIDQLRNPELMTSIGNGRNGVTRNKIGNRRNFFKGMRTIEPIWCYPTAYNALNPLMPSWYDPEVWYVMGSEVHKTRLLSFIGRPVPDILKPAYAFGGLSMTQMAQPYVDIWLRTRESVGEIIHSFSVMILKTQMATTTMPGGFGGGGGDVLARLALFMLLRDNQGVFAVDKETEDFMNVSAPISGLDQLQAQAQEHMFSVARIPSVKFTGLSPHGLNASSEGELRAFEETIHGAQEAIFRDHLTTVYDLMQISLWGERDPDITYDFMPLQEMTPKEKAEILKINAETDQIRIDSGTVSQEEARTKLANDPDSGYDGIDPDDVPDLLEEEEAGLEPAEGRPQPQAAAGEQAQGVEPSAEKPTKDGGTQNFDGAMDSVKTLLAEDGAARDARLTTVVNDSINAAIGAYVAARDNRAEDAITKLAEDIKTVAAQVAGIRIPEPLPPVPVIEQPPINLSVTIDNKANTTKTTTMKRLKDGSLVAITTDEWNESDHPRGQPGNAGQFGSGGGGSQQQGEG